MKQKDIEKRFNEEFVIYSKENERYEFYEDHPESVLTFIHQLLQEQKAESVTKKLKSMSDEERLEVFHGFCVHCGDIDPACACWNDE
jgi:hypothetical protein